MSTPVKHGRWAYKVCRCVECRADWALYLRERRARNARRRDLVEADGGRYIVEGITHGISGYVTYSCRCDTCRAVKAAKAAAYRRRRAAVA